MIMAKAENKLKSAFILLRCDKKVHNDCRPIRNALLEKFPNVRMAYTTNAEIGGVRWCVAATALVNAAEADKFEKGLFKLKSNHARPTGVSNVRFAMDGQ